MSGIGGGTQDPSRAPLDDESAGLPPLRLPRWEDLPPIPGINTPFLGAAPRPHGGGGGLPAAPARRQTVADASSLSRQRTGAIPMPIGATTPIGLAIHIISSEHDHFGAALYAHLFALDPMLRFIFPTRMSAQNNRFVTGLLHVLRAVDASSRDGDTARIERIVEFARQLGRDHRKYGINAGHYSLMKKAIKQTARETAPETWTPEALSALDNAVDLLATEMSTAADAEEGRAVWTATVLEVQRRTRDMAVVRLQADGPVEYFAGQYLSVSFPQYPGTWRYLSPALPPGPEGFLEFHVKSIDGGRVSRSIVTGTRPGDQWIVATPHGEMEVPLDGRDVLMIAGGTGLAPLRALILQLAQRGDAPRVHLFVGTRYPGELYDLTTLWGLASSLPWLTVQPVVEETVDPWWLHPEANTTETPGLAQPLVGTLVDVVTSFGDWADRHVLIAGPAEMITATKQGLIDAGTPRENISHDPL